MAGFSARANIHQVSNRNLHIMMYRQVEAQRWTFRTDCSQEKLRLSQSGWESTCDSYACLFR